MLIMALYSVTREIRADDDIRSMSITMTWKHLSLTMYLSPVSQNWQGIGVGRSLIGAFSSMPWLLVEPRQPPEDAKQSNIPDRDYFVAGIKK
jgi:hypothetical protein